MHLKRLFAAGTAGFLALVLLTATALACGGHHRAVSTTCQLCTVEGCDIAGRHTHSGVTYCGYAHAAGSCDGACAPLCALVGCDIAGRHTHGGTACCGYHHEGGFCDGSCVGAADAGNATPSSGGYGHHGHHGGHH